MNILNKLGILSHINLEEMTSDIVSKLKFKNLEVYFVVYELPDQADYEFVGITYNKQSAMLLAMENSKKVPCKIFRLDLGKLIGLAEKSGLAEEI